MSACQPHKTLSQRKESSFIVDTDAKMKLFILSVVCAFIQIGQQNSSSQWTLLPNILVVEVDGTKGWLPLSCLQPEELKSRGNESLGIFWMKDGKREAQTGNTYQVWLQESLGGGSYTCYSQDGSLLNHTEVLIQEQETMRRKILVKTDHDYLKCSAQNYNGEFHCSWTWDSSRASKVAFIKAQRASDDDKIQCSMDASSQHWNCSSNQSMLSCSVDNSGNSITCVDEQHCPYAEESKQIHITVYVKSEYFLVENYSKRFYLSEIVKPDKVQINRVNTTLIEWSYPSSWNSPYSYFPLTFQVAQFKRECKRCVNPCTDSKPSKTLTVYSTGICQFEVKHRSKAVCVRAKDALCNSQWSEWSHLRLKKSKRNKKNKH
ncbi:interleukin 12Ba [Cheilinus undulatus]|uniref:interleukin 12Ba n=1 Tax=Cheilinus undulatus TaxID=241271 RepID=UPI001BD1C273|nr:interleukin 12Ba [Cheilinus undulatus]